MQIFKGIKPVPEINDWVANFINDIKLVIIGLIYAEPIIIIAGIFILQGNFSLFIWRFQSTYDSTRRFVIGVFYFRRMGHYSPVHRFNSFHPFCTHR